MRIIMATLLSCLLETSRDEALQKLMGLVRDFLEDGCLELPKIEQREVDPNSNILRVYSAEDQALLLRPGARAVAFFAIVDVLVQNLRGRQTRTLRDVFYILKGMYFQTHAECLGMIRVVLFATGLSRASVGLVASARGLVAGPINIITAGRYAESAWTSCCSIRSEILIPGVLRIEGIEGAKPRFILVVEKEAIFHILVEHRLHQERQGIILTGRGMPCLATRAFLRALNNAFPDIPVVGIADWNPFGLAILLTFAHGSSIEVEAYHYAVPALRAKGLLKSDIERYGASLGRAAMLLPFTDLDKTRCDSIFHSFHASEICDVGAEVSFMLRMRSKLELESLISVDSGFFNTWVLSLLP